MPKSNQHIIKLEFIFEHFFRRFVLLNSDELWASDSMVSYEKIRNNPELIKQWADFLITELKSLVFVPGQLEQTQDCFLSRNN